MKTRTEKYETTSKKTRAERNASLYQDVQNITLEYEYIDTNNVVDLSGPTKNRTSRADFQKQKELDKIIPREKQSKNIEVDEVTLKEDRVYDIDEILKKAKESSLFEEDEKKRLNTEYNILTKLDVNSLENDEMKKEDRRLLVDDVYDKEQKKKKKKKKEEEKDLLNELISNDPEDTISNEIKLEELTKEDIAIKDVPEIKEEKEKEDTDKIVTQLESVTLTTNTNIDFNNKKKEKERKKLEKLEKKEKKKKRKSDDFVFTTEEIPVQAEEKKLTKTKEAIEDTLEFENENEGKGLMIAIVIITILIIITIGFFIYEYFFA